jgi:hypothetical protein
MEPKMTPTTLQKLPPATQREWLRQHIPHRICAALTWLTINGDWAMPPDPEWKDKEKDKFHIWCIGRSVDEGRKAAMRWLIEFVGIAKNKKEMPDKPNYKPKDVWIEHFTPGILFNLADPNAQKLADVWQGCSQASMHSTKDTNHPFVDPPDLAEALKIAIEHLEKNLYAPNQFILWEIVRDQEEKTHPIWR